ncbi:hypothetical protein CERSUDRAFT_100884 [Gelatoporia subvermispora B]|uniref:Uncharacterized protein n=1 Tax=Ceriporiopsis subvermispora (strain B) TaxID=914234 RepID=M2QYC7_CERS8|nr:hypothetical protein CERSUDRAFT_100884 [Gelatoporia subvermispora B]
MLKKLESSLQLQLNASAQLELTGLSKFMTPGRDCDMTASTPIGQVRLCSYHTDSDIGQSPTISMYIDLASSFANVAKLYCTITGESPNKAIRYFEHHKLLSCICSWASLRHIRDVITKADHWDTYPTLQSDDAIILKITVSTSPGPSLDTQPVADQLCRSIVRGGMSSTVYFVAFSRRTRDGRLTHPQTLVAAPRVLGSSICLFSTFDAADFRDVFQDSKYTKWQADASYTDADSDFEEDDDNNVATSSPGKADESRHAKLPFLRCECLDFLKSRLTVKNIMTEFFSTFTSEYKEVEDMELEILSDLWEELKQQEHFEQQLRRVIDHGSDRVKSISLNLLGQSSISQTKRRRLT